MQLKDSKNKEKILKVSRELIQVFHKGIRIRLGMTSQQQEKRLGEKQFPESSTFPSQGNDFEARILYQAKLLTKYEGRMKMKTKHKLRNLYISNTPFQEVT